MSWPLGYPLSQFYPQPALSGAREGARLIRSAAIINAESFVVDDFSIELKRFLRALGEALLVRRDCKACRSARGVACGQRRGW